MKVSKETRNWLQAGAKKRADMEKWGSMSNSERQQAKKEYPGKWDEAEAALMAGEAAAAIDAKNQNVSTEVTEKKQQDPAGGLKVNFDVTKYLKIFTKEEKLVEISNIKYYTGFGNDQKGWSFKSRGGERQGEHFKTTISQIIGNGPLELTSVDEKNIVTEFELEGKVYKQPNIIVVVEILPQDFDLLGNGNIKLLIDNSLTPQSSNNDMDFFFDGERVPDPSNDNEYNTIVLPKEAPGFFCMNATNEKMTTVGVTKRGCIWENQFNIAFVIQSEADVEAWRKMNAINRKKAMSTDQNRWKAANKEMMRMDVEKWEAMNATNKQEAMNTDQNRWGRVGRVAEKEFRDKFRKKKTLERKKENRRAATLTTNYENAMVKQKLPEMREKQLNLYTLIKSDLAFSNIASNSFSNEQKGVLVHVLGKAKEKKTNINNKKSKLSKLMSEYTSLVGLSMEQESSSLTDMFNVGSISSSFASDRSIKSALNAYRATSEEERIEKLASLRNSIAERASSTNNDEKVNKSNEEEEKSLIDMLREKSMEEFLEMDQNTEKRLQKEEEYMSGKINEQQFEELIQTMTNNIVVRNTLNNHDI